LDEPVSGPIFDAEISTIKIMSAIQSTVRCGFNTAVSVHYASVFSSSHVYQPKYRTPSSSPSHFAQIIILEMITLITITDVRYSRSYEVQAPVISST
jgi:hypothetical protein